MKGVSFLRRFLCFSISPAKPSAGAVKARQSSDFLKQQEPQEDVQESGIDPGGFPHTPSRSLIAGTIYGRRCGHVSFCVQPDPASLPPFLFELPLPTALLAGEMGAGVLRISLECRPTDDGCRRSSGAGIWTAWCNGRRVGYAVRRRLGAEDLRVLEAVRSTSAGAGVMVDGEGEEVVYMRATYDRVVGSRDSVSYHLVNPRGSSPSQELSVFLLRTTT